MIYELYTIDQRRFVVVEDWFDGTFINGIWLRPVGASRWQRRYDSSELQPDDLFIAPHNVAQILITDIRETS